MSARASLAQAMVAALAQRQVLAPQWREAFLTVPREVFEPAFFHGPSLISADTVDGLAAVYSDTPLLADMPTPGDSGLAHAFATARPTARPSLIARMLGLLEPADSERVLEAGATNGYTTALLCHRFGADNVVSVGVDAELAGTVRARLASVGHTPLVIAGDPTGGVLRRAPYTRILAMSTVAVIPPAWTAQLVAGGRIVAPVGGALETAVWAGVKSTSNGVRGLLVDVATELPRLRSVRAPIDGAAWGDRTRTGASERDRLSDTPEGAGGGPQDSAAMASGGGGFDLARADSDTSDELSADAFGDRTFRFLLQYAVVGLRPVEDWAPDGRAGVFLHTGDGSWMFYEPTSVDASRVSFGGPRPLWPAVTGLWQWWHRQQLPGLDRFGLTCFDDGDWRLWLDHEGHTVATATPERQPRSESKHEPWPERWAAARRSAAASP